MFPNLNTFFNRHFFSPIEREIQDFFYTSNQVQTPSKTERQQKKSNQFYYKPSKTAEQTSVKVGNSRVNCSGPITTFKEFIERLIEKESELINRKNQLLQDLKGANELVKKTIAIRNVQTDFISLIKVYRNELLLQEPTDAILAQRKRIDEMLKQVKAVVQPVELTEQSVEEFEKTLHTTIESLRPELKDLQSQVILNLRQDVRQTLLYGQKIGEESEDQIELKNRVAAATDNLQAQLLRLSTGKEKIFKIDPKTFETYEELSKHIQLSQEAQEKIKQLEIDCAFLMQKAPRAPVFNKEEVEKYVQEVAALIGSQEDVLKTL